jgi:hypothetical protein
MALHWKLVMDCAEPHRQAAFWSAALGYLVEDHSALIKRLLDAGAITEDDITQVDGGIAWRQLAAVRHPDDPLQPETGTGLGRRILFQAVPEGKTAKNRLHIDVHVGPANQEAEVARLAGLGATTVGSVRQLGGSWVTMRDPEGNEFDVQ